MLIPPFAALDVSNFIPRRNKNFKFLPILGQDPCQLPMNAGQGNYALPRWYFDSSERLCKPFSYRGAKGNSNNFMSPDECMTVCPVYVDPCPPLVASLATPATLEKRNSQTIIYCSAAAAAAVSSIHHHYHRQSPSLETRISPSAVCPPNYWCHIGADSKSTVCCPSGGDNQFSFYLFKNVRFWLFSSGRSMSPTSKPWKRFAIPVSLLLRL